MLTPDFSLSQTEEAVIILMRMPYIRAQEVEIRVDGKDFRIYARPYYLWIKLPGRMVEDETMRATYDVGSGEMKVIIRKEEKGEYFKELDLLTKLFVCKRGSGLRLGRELIEEAESEDREDAEKINAGSGIDFSCVMEPGVSERTGVKYGFNNQYDGLGEYLREMSYEIVRLEKIDSLSAEDRRRMRINDENNQFNEEHYLADYGDLELLKPIMDFYPETRKILAERRVESKVGEPTTEGGDVTETSFTEAEKKILVMLSNRAYIITDERSVYLGMADLILAYCYDHRTTLGEATSESAWTIATLSSLLSNLDSFTSLYDVVEAFVRRSLAFPLYRNLELSKKCIEDAVDILELGKRGSLKVLLSVKACLDNDERTHILSRIYLDDYCVWVQKCLEINIQRLAGALSSINIKKDICGWDIETLEARAVA